jgi:hypothetical protein
MRDVIVSPKNLVIWQDIMVYCPTQKFSIFRLILVLCGGALNGITITLHPGFEPLP